MTQSNFFTRFKLLYNENNLDDLNKNFNEIRKLENMNQSRLWTKIGLANCSLIKRWEKFWKHYIQGGSQKMQKLNEYRLQNQLIMNL